DVYFISYLPSQLIWTDVLVICGAALGMSFLATLYPAWRASRPEPAEALRYDWSSIGMPQPEQGIRGRPPEPAGAAEGRSATARRRSCGHRRQLGLGQDHAAEHAGRPGHPYQRGGLAGRMSDVRAPGNGA